MDYKYDSNITAGGLLLNEFLAIRPIIQLENFEELLRADIEENKFISISTRSARQRIVPQIIKRVSKVPTSFWIFFYGLELKEKNQALLYLCLKTYPLVFDIHFEVTVKKYKTGGKLTEYDIQMRLDEIASNDDYVASWSNSTFKKINTRYCKAIEDAGLYANGKLIKSEVLNPSFWNYFKENGDNWFLTACFTEI